MSNTTYTWFNFKKSLCKLCQRERGITFTLALCMVLEWWWLAQARSLLMGQSQRCLCQDCYIATAISCRASVPSLSLSLFLAHTHSHTLMPVISDALYSGGGFGLICDRQAEKLAFHHVQANRAGFGEVWTRYTCEEGTGGPSSTMAVTFAHKVHYNTCRKVAVCN